MRYSISLGALALAAGFLALAGFCAVEAANDLRVGAAVDRGDVERRATVLGGSDDVRKSSRHEWRVGADTLVVNSDEHSRLYAWGAEPVDALYDDGDLVAVVLGDDLLVSDDTGTQGAITVALRGLLCLLVGSGVALMVVHLRRRVPRPVAVVVLSGVVAGFLVCVLNGSGFGGGVSLVLLALAWPALGVLVARRWFR